jgi:hypothetical protein
VIAILLTFTKILAWGCMVLGVFFAVTVLPATKSAVLAEPDPTQANMTAILGFGWVVASVAVALLSLAWIVASWGVTS